MRSAGDTAVLAESPDHPGWLEWRIPGAFNQDVIGTLIVKAESGSTARTRIFPAARLGNIHGAVHGGAIAAFADASLFAGPSAVTGQDLSGAVTIDLSVQFTGSADLERPLDGLTSVLRETGRMIFVQGRIVQGDSAVAGFSGILRKVRPAAERG